MDTFSAFAKGRANRGKDLMVFDWNKAAKIIKERNAKEASAGLSGDWEWTGGTIFTDGKPMKKENTDTYLASTWATPELEIDDEIIPCFKMQKQLKEGGYEWGAKTFWPESALEILNQ